MRRRRPVGASGHSALPALSAALAILAVPSAAPAQAAGAGREARPARPRAAAADTSIPRVTLSEALERAARLDPNYVAASRQVDDAAWFRRSAMSVFFLPTLTATTSATRYSSDIFNIGTGQESRQIVDARLEASYDLFRGGSKFYDLRRARAELDGAQAGERQARYASALLTESDYYDVLAQQELTRVARERLRRADEQLAVARARVLSGAAVRTDSLQLVLEATRARVDLLRQSARLKVARVQLGRRVGVAGPVDAVPFGAVVMPDLPLSEAEAVAEAVAKSPRSMMARADEDAASAAVKSVRGSFLPQVTLYGQLTSFDDQFFPNATTRSFFGVQASLPIWNGGQRESLLSQAKSQREVARATRSDTELQLRRDVIEAYQGYETARASARLAVQGVTVATENLSVQQDRYRAGATTIVDLLTAQVDLAEAEAEEVQARYAARLALAGLEAVLGRRLFSQGSELP